MTVAELLKLLQEMPADKPVIVALPVAVGGQAQVTYYLNVGGVQRDADDWIYLWVTSEKAPGPN